MRKTPYEIKVGLLNCISICKNPFSDILPMRLQIGIARMAKDAYDYIKQLEMERDALKRDLCQPCPNECEPCNGYEWSGVDCDKQ